ncbi:DDE-type integrase/transposase/recombinase [Streptomyces sp. NPDC059787]|uniref:DDE-type integrase/transposase/recombinase n=1 Tax=Streptomyces sp. NPDC059787 TaxID=3346947 RepID=UPI003659AF08
MRGHRRVRPLARRGAVERDGVLPELLRVRRLASHLDIPPWTIKIHCQGVHSRGSASVIYVAFVVDTFFRRIVGWTAATVKETVFVLDAPEMAIRQRDRGQHPFQPGELIHHSDAGAQYTSFRLSDHLEAAGIAASIGSVGDAYDSALMESTIGLFKTG